MALFFFSCIFQGKIIDTFKESFTWVLFHKVYTLFYLSRIILFPVEIVLFLEKTQKHLKLSHIRIGYFPKLFHESNKCFIFFEKAFNINIGIHLKHCNINRYCEANDSVQL